MIADDYKLLRRCVEDGIQHGIIRARKHTDTPNDDELMERIADDIMLEVTEWFVFNCEEE